MVLLEWNWRSVQWILSIIGLWALASARFFSFPSRRRRHCNRSAPARLRSIGLECRTFRVSRPATARLSPIGFIRLQTPTAQNIAIVIHGSAGHSTGMNEIAKRLAADNFMAVSPDIRGHGESGTRGDIGHYGQLDDDLEDLLAQLRRAISAGAFRTARIFFRRRFRVACRGRQAFLRLSPPRPAVALSRL